MSHGTAARTDASTGHLDALDGWRGVAIGLLLIGHFLPSPGINFARVGVNFFFVLSGLLMARILFVQDTPIPLFYRRRIARIVPAHLAFIVLVLVAWTIDGRAISACETITAVLFVNNYLRVDGSLPLMPYGHIWSLSVEEQSYILLSLLALLTRRCGFPGARLLAGVALACAVFTTVYGLMYPASDVVFRQWLQTEVAAWGIFSSGALFVALHRRRLPPFPAPTVPLLVLVGVLLHWWSVPPAVQQIAGVGAFALAVNLLPTAPAGVRAVFSVAPLRTLGLWSFSIYLWQAPFYHSQLPRALAVVCAIAAGVASFYLLESPVRRYLNQRWGQRRGGAEIATG